MVEKVGRLPAHWPLRLVQVLDLDDYYSYVTDDFIKITAGFV